MKNKIFIVIGTIFIIVGVFIIISEFVENNKCTVKTVATVVGTNEEKSVDKAGVNHTYYPIVEYVANNENIRTRSNKSYSYEKYKKNQKIDILYNQNKAEEFIIDDDEKFDITGILFVIFGCATFFF